jgi:hypothetical protein
MFRTPVDIALLEYVMTYGRSLFNEHFEGSEKAAACGNPTMMVLCHSDIFGHFMAERSLYGFRC